ncbi:hypothetical protein IKD67_01810 [Candidatus Saccharibacteria bacterium]|nr:hypothetical protein [Candidatus Saccharibacteria bacterium]
MPRHTHTIFGRIDRYQGNGTVFREPFEGTAISARNDVATDYAGGGQPHENMPPYETIYYWLRTS